MTLTCSSPAIGMKIAKRLARRGFRYQSALEVLGIEVNAGRPIRHRRLRERIHNARKRQPRLRRIQKAGSLAA
eukprot:3431914-Pyramimonas_sp.AAC.1